jgi:8-oxo-dGTP pyrophosphatase MutT (NUDIX family)
MAAAGCIVLHGSSVLLGKRTEGPGVIFPGYWSIFAGSLDSDHEKPRNCAARELFEETLIKVKPEQLTYLKTLINGNKRLDLFYIKFENLPDVTLNFEHTEFMWINRSMIHTICDPIDDNIIEAINSVPD